MESKPAKSVRFVLAIFAFLLILAIFPFATDPTSIKTVLLHWTAVICLGICLFGAFFTGERLHRPAILFIPYALFLGGNLLSTFFAWNVGYAFSEFTKLASLFILFLVAAFAYRTPRQVWALITVICFAMSVAFLYGLIQYAGLDPFPWEDRTGMLRSAPATFGNPNFASHSLVLAVVLAGGLAAHKRTRWPLLFVILFLGHFSLTKTRGSLLALACAGILVVVARLAARKTKSPARTVAITTVVFLALGLAGAGAVLAKAKMTTGSPYPYDRSLLLRFHSFYGACEMIKDRPWVGHGLGHFKINNPPYWTPLEKQRLSERRKLNLHVHNEPLEFAVDSGFPTAAAYLAIFIFAIYYALLMAFAAEDPERRRLGLTLAAFFLAFLIDGLFGFNMHVPVSAAFLSLMAGAMAGTCREMRSERETSPRALGPLLRRAGAFSVAVAISTRGTADFLSQYYEQKGRGAKYWKAYDAAHELFDKAELFAPYNWTVPFRQASMFMTLERPDLAAGHLKRTLERNPNHVLALFEMAKAKFNHAALTSEEDLEVYLNEAIEYARRSAGYYPEFPEVHDLLGRAALIKAQRLTQSLEAGDPLSDEAKTEWQEAEAHLLHAVDYGSRAPHEPLKLLALAQFSLGRHAAAEEALGRALAGKPTEEETWTFFYRLAEESGRYEAFLDAVDWRVNALRQSPVPEHEELAGLFVWKARALQGGYNDTEEAEALYLSAVREDPSNLDVWASFYSFADSTGRYDRFKTGLLTSCDQLGARVPSFITVAASALDGDAEGLVNGPVALLDALQKAAATGESTRLRREFEWVADLLLTEAEGASLTPGDSGKVYLSIGIAHRALENLETAKELFERALHLLSGRDRALCLKYTASTLLEMNQLKGAVEMLRQAAAEAPDDVEARWALARILAQDGRAAQARHEYQMILKLDLLTEEIRRVIEGELQGLSGQ